MTSEQPVGGSTDSLMRHTTVRCGRLKMEKIYTTLLHSSKANQTKHIEGVLKDENGKEVSFLKKAMTCTFHFRMKLWLID